MSTTVQVLAVVIGVMLTSVWIMEAFLYRPQAGEALVYFTAAQHVFLAGGAAGDPAEAVAQRRHGVRARDRPAGLRPVVTWPSSSPPPEPHPGVVCEWPRGSLAREFAERGTPGSRAGRPSPVYESAGLLPRLVEAAAVAATALWRQNPHLCRIVLREHDVPGGVNIGLIEQTVRYALDHRYDSCWTGSSTPATTARCWNG